MGRNSPVAVFLAASAILTSNSLQGNPIQAEDMGGIKEWTTDQAIDDESIPDEATKKATKKAKDKNICIPIGEGENCW